LPSGAGVPEHNGQRDAWEVGSSIQRGRYLMPARRKPLTLTPLERQAYTGFMARYQAIDLSAQLARERTEADERAFVASLAVGLEVDSIGAKYRVNTEAWTLEPVSEPSDGQ